MEANLILGASRGLGRELAKEILRGGEKVVGVARKGDRLDQLAKEFPNFLPVVADFSKPKGQADVLALLTQQKFARVFYCAGGGPYGSYHQRDWLSHQWALDVTFTMAARILLHLSADKKPPQTVLIGSAVAESEPDPGAASYCAAKHALRGLYESLKVEYPDWDLRLYSPGYMDTDMIPPNAAVRNRRLHSPVDVAKELWLWTLTSGTGGHMMAPKYPEENL